MWPAFLMGQDLKQLPGQYSNMVYRQADGKLYALRYSSSDNTQYLDRIDPLFARVEEAYQVNAASGILALSDNQDYLYMGTPDSIVRFSFASQAVDLRFAHQLNTNQVVYPRDMRALSNQPDAVAVLWNYGYYAETYLAIYDQGVRRPNIVSTLYDISTFAAAQDGQYLYGYNAFTTGSTINRMQVTPAGPVLLANTYFYLREFSSGMDCLGDRLYGTDGTVVDIAQDTNLSLAGRLQIVVNQTTNQGRILPFGAGHLFNFVLYVHQVAVGDKQDGIGLRHHSAHLLHVGHAAAVCLNHHQGIRQLVVAHFFEKQFDGLKHPALLLVGGTVAQYTGRGIREDNDLHIAIFVGVAHGQVQVRFGVVAVRHNDFIRTGFFIQFEA